MARNKRREVTGSRGRRECSWILTPGSGERGAGPSLSSRGPYWDRYSLGFGSANEGPFSFFFGGRSLFIGRARPPEEKAPERPSLSLRERGFLFLFFFKLKKKSCVTTYIWSWNLLREQGG
uniref:Uncharacterized protein n=1 Tax=Morchella brunnea TaxID=1174671 RepID=A0A8K1MGE3_9PEZI|nr:hypothetical protein LK370_mgp087 [Morchella brunnea]UBU98448.1 hypothetical protein [Morchella brunnea]